MKKILSSLAALALMVGIGLAAASPAQAATPIRRGPWSLLQNCLINQAGYDHGGTITTPCYKSGAAYFFFYIPD